MNSPGVPRNMMRPACRTAIRPQISSISDRMCELKKVMEDNVQNGMQTFDQALLKLYQEGAINEETALAEADNVGDLKLKLKQANIAASGKSGGGLKDVDTSKLSLG